MSGGTSDPRATCQGGHLTLDHMSGGTSDPRANHMSGGTSNPRGVERGVCLFQTSLGGTIRGRDIVTE